MCYIKNFIDALSKEIDALKRGSSGSNVTVYNGELVNQTLDFYIYQFTLENFLVVIDDTPANIKINDKVYDCDIISVSGQQIQISIKYNFGALILSATIITNTWYLLERLKNKFEDNLNNLERFNISDRLFQDNNSQIDGGNFNPTYSKNNDNNPNESQHKAIVSSINEFISIIWGPPGTGKTATIAKAIENHLYLRRKILLLSHSNNAVDQALIKVAQQTKKTYYENGEIIRLGTPKTEMLKKIEENFPLVLISKNIEQKSKDLIEKRNRLNKDLEKLKDKNLKYEYATILDNIIKEKVEKINQNEEEINKLREVSEMLSNEITEIENNIKILKEKLNKSLKASLIKRTLLSLNPIKIEEDIKTVKMDLLLKTEKLNNKELQLNQIYDINNELITVKNKAEEELSNCLKRLNKNLDEINSEIIEINNKTELIQLELEELNKKIEGISNEIINSAKLIATTLTKSYIAKELEKTEFDILIVDEVSMAPMPMLYWAASKVKKGITLVGDFMQLPPICISDNEIAKKWLGQSIFNHLDISEINKAERRPVQLLDIQYRMNPCISEIINNKIYDKKLRDDNSVYNNQKYDCLSQSTPVCFINTTPHYSWCSQFESGGRFNLINALICVQVVEKILDDYEQNETIGIITPYRNQARLILKIAEDKGLIKKNKDDRVKVNTVHSFQGGEETAIIFDSVEGPGAKKWSMINENNSESARLLLNVAITRAEKKLYIIANGDFIKKTFPNNSLFMDVLKHFIDKGKEIKSTEIFSDLRDEKFDDWIKKINPLKNRSENYGTAFTQDDFWPAFYNDLSRIEKELIIFSPFLTSDRLGKLQLIFNEIIKKGIKIFVITLPPNQQPNIMRADSIEVMVKLKEMRIGLKFRIGMHEKIAILDDKIEWFGSLNILSHNNRKEYMKRFEGDTSIKELKNKYDLENLLYKENINGEFCPLCKKIKINNFIVPKQSRQNRRIFYGCSGFSECKFTANINIRNFDDWNDTRTNTNYRNQERTHNNENSNNDETTTDLFGNTTKGRQWETKKCYWSSLELPGYIYSKKKNAWWKSK